MGDTGYKTAGVVKNDVPGGSWSPESPGNLATSDDVYIFTVLSASDAFSDGLLCTNFGFSIPSNVTIDGVEVQIEKHGATNRLGVLDFEIVLTEGGDNKQLGGLWPAADTTFTYGGASDTWGNLLTPALVEDADFGISIIVQNFSFPLDTETAFLDFLQMKVHFTESVPGAGVPALGGNAGNMGLFGAKGVRGGYVD